MFANRSRRSTAKPFAEGRSSGNTEVAFDVFKVCYLASVLLASGFLRVATVLMHSRACGLGTCSWGCAAGNWVWELYIWLH